MARSSNPTPSHTLATWLSGHWFKILSISIPIIISVAASSFYLGQIYANLNFEYEKIKMERECSDRLNQEIDKNRQLQDEKTKESIDNIKSIVQDLKQKVK